MPNAGRKLDSLQYFKMSPVGYQYSSVQVREDFYEQIHDRSEKFSTGHCMFMRWFGVSFIESHCKYFGPDEY
jgi:hypothetical protein